MYFWELFSGELDAIGASRDTFYEVYHDNGSSCSQNKPAQFAGLVEMRPIFDEKTTQHNTDQDRDIAYHRKAVVGYLEWVCQRELLHNVTRLRPEYKCTLLSGFANMISPLSTFKQLFWGLPVPIEQVLTRVVCLNVLSA